MKNTRCCPKCHSENIVRVPDNPSRYTSGNNIYTTTVTLFGKIPVIRYVCCNCGYVENWVENRHELDKIKKTFGYLQALSPLFRPLFCVLPQRPCVHYTELLVGFVGRSLTKPAQIVDIFYLYGIFHVCSFPCGQRQVSFPLPFNPFLSAHS